MSGVSEEVVHSQICQYLRLQYPQVLFNTDLLGIRLTPGQARKVKPLRSSRAWPDIFLPEPRGQYFGLYVELKKEDVCLLTKKGTLQNNLHYREQDNMLKKLMARGYKAVFAVGFDQAKEMIDEYLNLNA
jgi:hypothetical protein